MPAEAYYTTRETTLQTGQPGGYHRSDTTLSGVTTEVLIGGQLVSATISSHIEYSPLYAFRYSQLDISIESPDASEYKFFSIDGVADNPVIAATQDGGFLITWIGIPDLIYPDDVYAARYTSEGDLLWKQQINKPTESTETSSNIVELSNGNIAVCWTGSSGSYVKVITPDGQSVIDDTSVQGADSIAPLADGSFLIAWTSDAAIPPSQDLNVNGQVFSSAGERIGGVIQISESTAGNQRQVATATLSNGNVIVVWSEYESQFSKSAEIKGQLFDSSGHKIGDEIDVSGSSSFFLNSPVVDASVDGGFVVGWRADYFVSARSFTSNGTALGDVFGIYPFSRDFELETRPDGALSVSITEGNRHFTQLMLPTAAAITIEGGSLGDTLYGNSQSNVISGLGGDDLLLGGAGNDTLRGGGGVDTLRGGTGDDVLDGGTGDDVLDGGDGTDTATYASSSTGVSLSLVEQKAFVAGESTGDDLISIENLVGSDFSDFLFGDDVDNLLSGGAGDDWITTGGGNDIVIGGEGTDTVSYVDSGGTVFVNLSLEQGFNNAAEGDTYEGIENVVGSYWNDVLIGNTEANRLDGSFGDDILIGGEGADVLIGGPDYDTASYVDSNGTVFVNLTLGHGFNNFAEGDTYQGIEHLEGSPFSDVFIGDNGVNRLDGGGGNDRLIGSLGGDILIGGAGSDWASYEDNQGSVFVNLMSGIGYNNAAEGDTYSGIENAIGGMFDDFLLGDDNANRLDGAMGADTLYGFGGADTFMFSYAPGAMGTFDHPNIHANVDTLMDFVSGEDKLEISASAFGGGLTPGALPAGAFAVGTAATDADDRFIYDQANGKLYFDADGSGSGAQVLMALLPNHAPIAASDFVVVVVV